MIDDSFAGEQPATEEFLEQPEPEIDPTEELMRDYIARKPAYSQEFADAVLERARKWKTAVDGNGLYRQARENYRMYHNAEPDGTRFEERSFALTGANGEFVRVRFNEFRKWLTYILNMATQSKIAMKSKAANGESDSLIAAQMFDGLLTYFTEQWKRSRSAKQLHRAKELALFTPISWVLCEWDTSAGTPYITTASGETITTGDLYVKTRSFWDVWFDTNAEDEDELDWLIVRDFYNKFDLIQRFKDKAEEIARLEQKNEWDRDLCWGWDDETDLVPVFKFFHRSTPSCPDGRVAWICADGTVLVDGPNPYREDGPPNSDNAGPAIIPVLMMRASDGLGSIFGYAPGNDIAPIQMAYNMSASGVVTTEAAFGVPNIVTQKGSDIAVQSLAGGMNNIEVAEGREAPTLLQLNDGAKNSMEVMAMLSREGEGLTGLNGAVTGNPEVVNKAASGRVMGLLQSQSVQFQNGFNSACAQLDQDYANLVLLICKRFPRAEQITSIIGKDKVMRMAKWNGDTFRSVARVVAESVNPVSKTLAGAQEQANFMLDKGLVKTPWQYHTVAETGQIEPLIRADMSTNNLIAEENEALLKGEMAPVLFTDDHVRHIPEHLALLDSPQIRRNGTWTKAILAHVAEHQGFAQPAQQPAPGQQPAQEGAPSNANGQAPQEQHVQGPGGQDVPLPAEATVTPGMNA